MKPGIRLTRIWFDDDMVELRIDASDGKSLFSNQVYVAHSSLAEVVSQLDTFKDHIHGGVFDLRFGEFGPEYANGAFHARLHFPKPGRLYITSKQESEFKEFSVSKVASGATLYLITEPGLLDRFIGELKALIARTREEAYLEAI